MVETELILRSLWGPQPTSPASKSSRTADFTPACFTAALRDSPHLVLQRRLVW